MSNKVNNSLPMTRISTRKSIEVQPNNKHTETDTQVQVTTEKHNRRKQTLKTILRDEAPVFLSHEEVVVSENLKKVRKPTKSRQKIEDLSRPLVRGGLTDTKARCIQVTEEVGKALRTTAWQNRKEDIGSVSFRSRQPANCDPDMMSVDSVASRKRVSTNIVSQKESTPTMFNKVRENRKASRCCAECKAVVFDREKLRLRAALGVKICDTCWSKKKPKEVHVDAQSILPRPSSPSVKKCLVKLFDVSRYPVGHPFGKGFLSQRSLKRRFNESNAVDNAASENIVQPKRARKNGSSTFPAEFVNAPKADRLKNSKHILHANEKGAKERTMAASNSRNVSRATTDVTETYKNEKTSRRKSEQSVAENTALEKLQEKASLSQLKVNAQSSPERRISRRNSINTETTSKTRISRRSSSNNESASEKRTLRKSSFNAESLPEKRVTKKGRENIESPAEKKPERSSMKAEISSERQSRRSSMNAETSSQKKTRQSSGVNEETASEKMSRRRLNADISGEKKTSQSSKSTETTPARVSRRNSVNTKTTSEVRTLRRISYSNETSGTTKRRISNNMRKSALSARIQSKNKNLPAVSRKRQNQVISMGKSKTAAAKLETKSDRNTSKNRLKQIQSMKLKKVIPEAAIAKKSLIDNKKRLVLHQNKMKTAIPVISHKGSALLKYSKQAEKSSAKRSLTGKTDNDLKMRKSLTREGSSKKSVFAKLHSKITTAKRIKKPSINALGTSLTEKIASSRKRKMEIPEKSTGVKKRKIESVPERRKTVVEKDIERAKNLTYKCDVCSKKYSSLAEERLHELSHSGRQPVLVLHKCDSPQGVLSLIREDDLSTLNIFSSDNEIQKDVARESNTGSNIEGNIETDIGTVQTVERKDEDTDTIQLANLENTEEQTKPSVNNSFEMVETEEVCDIDHEKSAPFDNTNDVSVSETREIEYSKQRKHSETDTTSLADEVDKNKIVTIIENTRASKAEAETPKQTSAICSPEVAKKPKSSDEIAVLLEEIFGESSEEDLISVTGIRNLRHTADAIKSGSDKTNEPSKEKSPCGVNSLQHISVNQNLGAIVPDSSASDTAEVVSQYLRGETHNPEEILHQLNYGEKADTENETTTSTETSNDTDKGGTSIKLQSDVELTNNKRDGDDKGGSLESSHVNKIEGKVTTFKDYDDEGSRSQLIINDELGIVNSQQEQSLNETVSHIHAEDTLEPSIDIKDNRNQTLKDSVVNSVGDNNVFKDKTSDEMSIEVISLEVNKDIPDSISKDNFTMVSVNGSTVSESSCKQSQNEPENQNFGNTDAYCIDSTKTSPDRNETDIGEKHNKPVVAESVNQEQQQTGDQEKQVVLETTDNPTIHEILKTCDDNDKFDDSELPAEICLDKQPLGCHEKEQSKSHILIQVEDSSEDITVVEQVNSGNEMRDQKMVQHVECIDNPDLLNKQDSIGGREIANIESYASEKCHEDTSKCFETSRQSESSTLTVGEGTSTDPVDASSNEKEGISMKDSLEDVLQSEICEDEVGSSRSGLIKDVLLVENKEANEILDSASTDIVSVTETDSRSIGVHSLSLVTTTESMEVESRKNSNDTATKPDESEIKDAELDLLAGPDSGCDATQEINSSHQTNIKDNTCDVSSLKSDSEVGLLDSGHDIATEDISTTLDNDPEVNVDNIEHVERSESAHTVEALNPSYGEETTLQAETLDPEQEIPVLNANGDLNVQFADQNDSNEMQAANNRKTEDCDVDDDCRPCTYGDDTNNSDKNQELIIEDPSKEEMPVGVDKTCQSVDSTNLVITKEKPYCLMEPPSANYEADTSGKSEEIEAESTAQETVTAGSSCNTQAVDSSCDDRTGEADCKVESKGLNFEVEVEVKETRQGIVTAIVDHEDEFVSANEVARDEVVVALDASNEGDASVSGDEVGDVRFVPSSDLNTTNSEITAGISDSIPSIVGVENLSFNVRHNVPDVFEEEEQILQEVEDDSILQETDCANRNLETLTKGQNKIQEAETEDNEKPPLVAGLNGINEKAIDECSTKLSGSGDLKDNLHLGDNDITGLEPISDDELDFM